MWAAHKDRFEIGGIQTFWQLSAKVTGELDAEESLTVERHHVGKDIDIGALFNIGEGIVVEIGGGKQDSPVDQVAQAHRVVEKDSMVLDMFSDKESLLPRRKVADIVVMRGEKPERVVVVVEEIVVAFERDVVEGERDVARVFAIDKETFGLEKVGDRKSVVAGEEVVVATFAVERQRVATRERRTLDDVGGQRERCLNEGGEIGESCFADAVVLLNSLGEREKMEEHATRRAKIGWEQEDGIVNESRYRLVTRGVEKIAPFLFREREIEVGERVLAAEERGRQEES